MTLEMYQGMSGRTMFKLDGKRVNFSDAEAAYLEGADFIDSTVCTPVDEFRAVLAASVPASINDNPAATVHAEDSKVAGVHYVNVPDRLAAINIVEENIAAPFIIDGKFKGCDCVFAKNSTGDELELHDDYIKVTQLKNDITTYFWLDVPESVMIKKLGEIAINAVEENVFPDSFTITGRSGKVYTYSEKSLEVLDITEVPIETDKTEKVTLMKVLRPKQEQFKKLIAANDVKSYAMAKRLSREIAALVVRHNALKDKIKSLA